ncbi:stanniocalcin family domain-containing [Trichoderma arundinaceum]|uniref:Stanniocalcin family domain-containing n=1 Tax=Trichoderma arundinaceum TaxID=490622 RepID=A0A395NFX1_TRIAR|nr:stanniocalcin family domain-containing [Trichoderma arundinaceum]
MKSLNRIAAIGLSLVHICRADGRMLTRDSSLPPKPACEPGFALVGVSTEAVNTQDTQFKAAISCSSLDSDKVFVFVNGEEHHDFQVSESEITFPNGLNHSTALVGIIAADTQGYPFVSSFLLHFGSSASSANASRNLLQSTSNNGCTACGDCNSCPGYAMCASTCQQPPLHQCDFYQTCVEDSVPCSGDPNSYAIDYGLKNCQKFDHNLDLFSDRGQQFIWGTMNCLQKDLVPVVSACNATCKSIHDAAFGSHAQCYIANGFCSLECKDYLAELYTVGLDLFSKDAIKSVFQTAGGCLERIEEVIEEGACVNNALKEIILTILDLLSS